MTSSIRDAVLTFISDAGARRRESRAVAANQLFTRLYELADGACALAAANRFTGIPVLARSCLEAFVDLLCLTKDSEYVQTMRRADRGFLVLLPKVAVGSSRQLQRPRAIMNQARWKSERMVVRYGEKLQPGRSAMAQFLTNRAKHSK